MDVSKIREDFPALKRRVRGRRLVYLDNAATTLKPVQVIEAVVSYYRDHCANVHRGIHTLSREATELYEESREVVAKFLNADASEVVFTSGTTESINLAAYSWGLANLRRGDVIVTTVMEHHSNMLPWRVLSELTGAEVRYVDVTDYGELDYAQLEEAVDERTRLVALVHVSNVLGTINDVRRAAKLAHSVGALLLVDGAQSVPHMPIDVRGLGTDFLAFSGHKMLGPTGIGVLYVRRDVAEEMAPLKVGGGAVENVTLDEVEYEDPPHRFEAGTPNIAGAIGLAEAVRYLSRVGMERVREHEVRLTELTLRLMSELGDSVEVCGPKDASRRCGIVTFNVGGADPDAVAALLDAEGIAVRSGRHCAHPLYRRLGLRGAVRASYYIYNTEEEVELLVRALERASAELSS